MRSYSVAPAPALALPVTLLEVDLNDADTLPLEDARGYSVAVARVRALPVAPTRTTQKHRSSRART